MKSSAESEAADQRKPVRLYWVFDVISPFAYLSLKQLHLLPASVSIECVPVLFAGLLDHFGQIGNAEIESKRRFTYRFTLWRARKLNIQMRFPPAHPFNPLAALRLIVAAGSDLKSVETVFDAIFKYGMDVSDSNVLADLARNLGIASPDHATKDPAIKQKLRQNTDWAIAQGVFGVPTFIVDDELFWGHDALEMVLDWLRDPAQWRQHSRELDDLPVGILRARRPRV
jgi:2-hydroxychromene-2-carboxylate isomerase